VQGCKKIFAIHEVIVTGRINFKLERIPQPRGLTVEKVKCSRLFEKWNVNV